MAGTMDTIIDNFPIPWLPLPTTQSALCDMAYTLQDHSRFDQDWKNSRFLPWRFFYLDYQHLQQMIKQHSDTLAIDRKLEDEWKKVHDFYMLKRGEIERRIESCHVHQDKSILHTISVDIHYLYHFAKLNYCGFILLFMQFHQLFGSPVHNTLEKRISNNSSIYNDSIALFRLAVQTNSLYQNIHLKSPYFHPKRSHVAFQQETTHINNQVGNCNLSASSYPSSIDSCETAHSDQDEEPSNTVKKYWIHPDNVLELILHLSSNMVIQDRHASHITAVDQVGHPESDKSNAINKVTTVYLDTPQFDGYAGLMRNEATSVTRIRWYNEGNTPKSYVELEKKAYARTEDSFAQKQLIQQRVWLKSKRLQSWLNGNYSIGCPFSKDSCQYRTNGTLTWRETDKQRMLETCLQIENQVHSKHQVPVLRVTQNRVVYGSVDGSVYISIDTDIAMMRYQQTLQDDYPYSSLREKVVRFPHCVVQISTTGSNKAPSWITDLTQCMLEPVDNFSTYLHGVGTLFRGQVEAVPNWFSHDYDIRHVEARGQWLIGKPVKKEKTTVGKNALYCNTIATIVTCYDDEIEQAKSPSSSSSLSNDCSQKIEPCSNSTLSPIPEQGLRRSFDSYCSFDHPTSSKSDPHNCRSCIGRMFIMQDTDQDDYKVIMPTSASSTSIYQPDNPVTFGSFLFQTFLPRRFRSLEKEPLLGGKKKRQSRFEYSSTASSSSTTLFDEELGQKMPSSSTEYSRATSLTVTCVIISFSMSYVFYILMLEKL